MVFDRYNDDWERLVWVLVQGRASLVTDAGGKAQAWRRCCQHRVTLPGRWGSSSLPI